ncbi:lipase 3-like [Ochlerotatus camptorhynchus]|uniref:lipase 3-like n=1 Tax=Ochlerotatus camptorhynchus TaxID=644619 RepID=UPI0031D6E18E
MALLLLAVIVVSLLGIVHGKNSSAPFQFDEEDALLTVPQLIRKYGYDVEEHQVLTEDDYLLTMFRIPPRNGSTGKRPILMMHSLLSSCSDFVLIGPKHALGYLLANRDYDIWLGNARGNRYSRKHKYFHIRSPKFWNFTFHEIGYYDVPALIDYVLDKTRSAKLHYVGFSQGTLISFVAMSSRPEYNAKVIQLQELSPAAYLDRTLSIFIRIMSVLAPSLGPSYAATGVYEFLPHWKGQYNFYNTVCPEPWQTLCRLLIYEVTGANPRQLDKKTLRIFLGHFPAGSGLKQMLHYTQVFTDGLFRQYDYMDAKQNRAAYGSSKVPSYNVSRITAPVRTYYGYNDNVINYGNVKRLERDLPNVVGSYPVPDERFSHVDFILANEVKELLYDEIVRNVEDAEREAS